MYKVCSPLYFEVSPIGGHSYAYFMDRHQQQNKLKQSIHLPCRLLLHLCFYNRRALHLQCTVCIFWFLDQALISLAFLPSHISKQKSHDPPFYCWISFIKLSFVQLVLKLMLIFLWVKLCTKSLRQQYALTPWKIVYYYRASIFMFITKNNGLHLCAACLHKMPGNL